MPRRKRQTVEGTAAEFNANVASWRLESDGDPNRWLLYDAAGDCQFRFDLPEWLAVLVAAGFVAGFSHAEARRNEREILENEQRISDLLARVPVCGEA